ncbi:MAG: hypothetical protein CMG31_00775 [Candidatus Marinimicrobia bacterium]|nr:hypothetical protein [Candidatus Neomarinimicrobiota bacterium]
MIGVGMLPVNLPEIGSELAGPKSQVQRQSSLHGEERFLHIHGPLAVVYMKKQICSSKRINVTLSGYFQS